MRHLLPLWAVTLLLWHQGVLAAEEPKEPAAGVARLLEDNGEELLPKLTNPTGCPGEGHLEKDDVFSGASSVRIVPLQRFEPGIAGWEYRIREVPKAGEFRYLRFAWKCRGSSGIMLQLHDLTDWHIRYTAGVSARGWMSQYVAEKPPDAWTLVTVDLFKDFGERTIRGMALTCFDGEAGYFDHIYFGRSIADLDRIDASGLGDAPPREWTAEELETKWKEANSADAAAAYRGFWTLVHVKPAMGLMASKLKAMQKDSGAATIKKWLAELDHDDFATREKATEELAKVVDSVATVLEEELARTQSAEVKFRLKSVLSKRAAAGAAPTGAPGAGQFEKALRILEFSSSEESKELLTELSRGEETDTIVKAAREAVKRREGN